MSNGPYHIARSGVERFKAQPLCGATSSSDMGTVCAPPSMATCCQCILLACGRPVPTYPPTPEHDRLREAKKTDDATQMLGQFLFEFLPAQGIRLARYGDDDELYEAHGARELIAEFFEVNENALESEKQALLKYQREINEATKWAETEGREILKART